MILRRPPAPPPGPLTLSKLLLVEGDTPMHFLEALLKNLGLDKTIEVRNFRGVGDFKLFLDNLAATPDFQQNVKSLGIIRDAEDKPAVDARKSVANALTAAGLVPTRQPQIQTSIYILPDDANPGTIETLCVSAVQSEPSLADIWSCVKGYFDCLSAKNLPLQSLPILAKNQVQVYLARHKDGQMFPGTAAYRGHWPFDNPVFNPLKQFLHSL